MKFLLLYLALIVIVGCRSSGYFLKENMTYSIYDGKVKRAQYNDFQNGGDGKTTLTVDDRQFSSSITHSSFYIENELKSEMIKINDSISFIIVYNKGFIYNSFLFNKKRNVVEGMVNFYGKGGLLSISAMYENGDYKNVVFYRNVKTLKQFLKKDKKIRFGISHSKS